MNITPSICIFESLNYIEEGRYEEGKILSRTLKLSSIKPRYIYTRTRYELKKFAEAFGRSPYGNLHLACHGNWQNFCLTFETIPYEEVAEILGPHLEGRRLFVSACRATHEYFAEQLLGQSKCLSIAGPVGAIQFDDAANFLVSFYHLMFKENAETNDEVYRILKKCAVLINEEFNFFTMEEGQVKNKSTHPFQEIGPFDF